MNSKSGIYARNANRAKPETPVSIKERLAALGNLPAFFKLVWQTSPWMTIVNSLLRVVRSAMPLLILYVGKLIIDQVIFLSHHSHHSHDYLWKLVAAEFGLAIL